MKSILLLLALFTGGYLLWSIKLWREKGLESIQWHTHLMVYPALWFVGLVLLFPVKLHSKSTFLKYTTIFSSVVFSLFLIEFFFVITGVNKTYLEKISGFYLSPYRHLSKSQYHTRSPNKDGHWLTKSEYSYWRPSNSHGISDREWAEKKDSDETRILALGDSFTEGDGAPYDSSYVMLLATMIKKDVPNCYVMNGGVCGSDPFFDFKILNDKLIYYKPDVIIQTFSSQDLLTDIILRGGMGRFTAEGSVKFRDPPLWEPLYAISYNSRLIFSAVGYNELLVKRILNKPDIEYINFIFKDLILKYASFCKKNGVQLILILRVEEQEIILNNTFFDFSEIIQFIGTQDEVIFLNLLPKYIDFIDQKNMNRKDLFWKKDGHHNSLGYKAMAEIIYQNIFTDSLIINYKSN